MNVTLDSFLEEMDSRQHYGSADDAYMAKLWAAMAVQLWESGPEYDPDVDLPEDNEWLHSNPDWLAANPPPLEAVVGHGIELRFNPHHGKDGKFSSGKTAVATSMLKASHEPDGGATIRVDGTVPKTGYVIAQPGTSGFIGNVDDMYDAKGVPTDKGIDDAVKYIDAHQDAEYLGVWHNPATGEITFDVVDRFPDEIGEAEAKRIGKERNQEAIFHLTSGTVIDTGGTGDARNAENEARDLEAAKTVQGNDGRREERVREESVASGEERINDVHDRNG